MKRRSLIPLLLAFLFLAVVVTGYVLWYKQLEATRASLISLSAEIGAKAAERARDASARDTLASLTADEAALSGHFVPTTNVVAFLEYFESLGTPYGADVEVASVADDGAVPRGRLTFALSITGSFNGVMRTLGALEYGAYAVSVKNVNLDAAAGEGDSTWRATLSASVETRTDPEPLP